MQDNDVYSLFIPSAEPVDFVPANDESVEIYKDLEGFEIDVTCDDSPMWEVVMRGELHEGLDFRFSVGYFAGEDAKAIAVPAEVGPVVFFMVVFFGKFDEEAAIG